MPVKRTIKMLAQRLIPTTSDSLIYTTPDSTTRTIIKTAFIANITNASKTFSLWINPSATTSGDSFALFKTVSIAANTTTQLNYDGESSGIVMIGSNASVIANASASNSIAITLFGIEIEES